MSDLYEGFFDGSAIPNPGQMRCGWYIKDPTGKIIREQKYVLGHGTNNEAEYIGLAGLVRDLLILNIKNVKIYGDSQLVVNQINGIYKVKKANLKEYHNKIKEGLSRFNSWSISHIYREDNQHADKLTRA